MQIFRSSRLGKGFWETVHNIGWVTSSRLLRMGGSLVVGTLVVRYLGPARYGTFSYAFAIYGLFNIVSNLGLDYLVVSEIALSTSLETEREVLGTALLLKVGASVVTTLCASAYAWATHRQEHVLVLMVALLSAAAITQGFDVVDYFFQARTRSRLTVYPQVVVFVLSNTARVIAVFARASLLTFGIIAALEIFAGEVGLAVVYLVTQRDMLQWQFHRGRAVSLLRSSWPLLISSLLIIVYMRTDQVLLGSLSTQIVVGEYAAASKLSEIWYAIPALVCTSVMPRLLQQKQKSPEMYYARLQTVYRLMAAISIALALLVTLCGRSLILLLFGKAYLPAASILAIHVWTGPFVFLGVVSGMQLIHEGLTHLSLQRSLAGAVCNVALNYLLIPRFGGPGSAVATLVTQVLAAYVMDGVNPETRHIFRMKTNALTGGLLFRTRPAAVTV